ncbi:MAG: hypothetical protein ACI9F9_003407 [Candidatus Paceibacteria bacterium]|jgi:hypothetical protein
MVVMIGAWMTFPLSAQSPQGTARRSALATLLVRPAPVDPVVVLEKDAQIQVARAEQHSQPVEIHPSQVTPFSFLSRESLASGPD